TDVSGSYTTQGIAPGSYKIKFDGSDEGYDTEWYNGKKDFNNANIITVIASNTTTEINSVLGKSTKSYSISGMVTGAVKKDVTITLSGNSSGTTTTDLMGNYSFSGLTNGTYTITPSKSGYTFTPANKTVTVDGSNFTGQNFTATASGQGYSISGKVVVTDTNAPLPDVTITLSGSASATTSTDSTGNYSFSMLPRGIYKITPLKTGYTFSPKNKWVIVNRANVTNKDFKAKGK
ncbi:MAG: carboxypeptidase regulatory-like domain-containing protein, partial [Proteobacteria bacterium]|nr:carboxypeptidase regulatory-like domain-containing protein [Pseudomonadota bacterium]